MRLLIDGDLFAYRCAASSEQEGAEIACQRMDSLLDSCLDATKGDSFSFFLTGPTNFRYKIYPEYKANRLNEPKPTYLADCKNYLIEKYNAVVSDNCEADDLMGIEQSTSFDTIIVSLDKDMLQIPGRHYSWEIHGGPAHKRWVKDAKFSAISKIDGARNFYTQMLTGDSSDNIKGVTGIGPVTAKKLLADANTEEEMFNIVRNAYGFDEIMLMNGRVLHIQRKKDELWEFPFETKEME